MSTILLFIQGAEVGQDWKHGYVHTNGIRMHYVEQGSGPLILLCHGWPESWFSWRHQIAPLARAGYRVVAMDQRGYADTDAPQAIDAYNVLNLVADLVGLVHALGKNTRFSSGTIGDPWSQRPPHCFVPTCSANWLC